MSVRTTTELMDLLRNRIGEDTSDEALTLIEDFNDTLTQLEGNESDGVDWKTKYEENDAQWRQRYKDRFFSKPAEDENDIDDVDDSREEDNSPRTFEDLFSVNK